MKTPLLLLFVLCALCERNSLAAENIWLEGEAPKKSDFAKHNWYDGVAKEGLSGHNWLSNYGPNPGVAEYEVSSTEGGEFVFWLRCNYFAAEMDYQLNAAAWTPIDLKEKNVRDGLMISAKPDHRFIGWVRVAKVTLNKGANALGLKIHSKLSNHGGIDCMVFSNTGFIPSGAMKPTAEEAAAPDTWFRVVPDDDAFSDKSIIDMSALLPKPAGKFGALKAAGKDLKFENGDGPVKFWGVNASVEMKNTPEDMARRARYFAKHGINMVRQHPLEDFLGPLKDGKFDERKLDQWDRWFAALKNQGIYMTWSIFYPHWISKDDGYPPELLAELQTRGGLYSTSGMVNFSRQLQDLELKYAKAILEHVNPHTKLAYKDDPALAVVEIHNEDCIFFHAPLTGLAASKPPKHAALLRKMFGDWAKTKYGTDEALQKAWGTNDSLASGELRLYGAWQFGHDHNQVDSKAHLGDMLHFLTDVQREYYARRIKEIKQDIGFKGVTVTTGWVTGGPVAEPANLYCDTAGDMIDRHNYFGGGAGGHGIAVGAVKNGTHMSTPGGGILSSGFHQVETQPFSMTEWTSCPPNQWKAEIAPLFAFYGMGLQGWDSSYHFAANGPRIGDGWPHLGSYCSDTPHYIGQFPAIAFALYKHHIQEAPIAAARRIKPDEAFTGDDAFKTSSSASGGTGADFKVATGLETPNAVLAIGRVTAAFDGKASEKIDWSKFWDADKKIVRSMTGELTWDYNKKVVTLAAPKTQAIIGFAGGGEYDLPGVKAVIKTDFCSLIFTPLDDLPLAESRHILITAMARDKQTNATYNAAGTQLTAVGGPPLLMEPVEATLTLKGPAIKSIVTADIYGVPTTTAVPAQGNAFKIDGTFRAYYYEVRR